MLMTFIQLNLQKKVVILTLKGFAADRKTLCLETVDERPIVNNLHTCVVMQ